MSNSTIGVEINTKSKMATDSLHDLSDSFVKVSRDGKRANNSMTGLIGSLGKLKNAVLGVGVYKLAKGFATATQSAMDSIESIHLFEVAMGDMAVETGKVVDEMSNLTGLDRVKLLDTVGQYNLLARSMGLTSQNAQKLSTNTTKLALDLASLTNRSIVKVQEDLRSGLIGQSKTMYKYGIDVTEAALAQEALNQGISKSVRHMSQGEKMALRYAVMIKQSALSHGDFALTIEQPANQLRIFSERILTLTRAIGSLFIPMLSKVLPYLNAFVTILTRVVGSIKRFFKIPNAKPIKNMSNGFGSAGDKADSMGDSIKKAGKKMGGTSKKAKKLKKELQALAGFDELNILNTKEPDVPETPSGSGGGAGGLGDIGGMGALDLDLLEYDSMLDKIEQKSDKIAKKIISSFKELFKDVDATNLINSFKNLQESLKPFMSNVGGGIKWFLENVLAPLTAFTINEVVPRFLDILAGSIDVLNAIIEVSKPAFAWLWDNILKPLAQWTGGVILSVLDDMSDKLGGLVGWIKDNPVLVGDWILSFAVLSGVFMSLIGVVNLVKDVFGLGIGAVKGLGKVFGFLTSPVGIVITVIALLITTGVLLYKNWDKIKEASGKLGKKITGIWDTIKDKYIEVYDKLVEKWNPILNWFSKLWDDLLKFPQKMWDLLSKKYSDVYNDLIKIWNPIIKWFSDTWGNIKTDAIKLWGDISTAISTVWSGLIKIASTTFTQVWDAIKNVMKVIPEWFRTTFTTAWSNVKSVFSTGGKVFTGIKDGIASTFKTVVNGLIGGINRVVKVPFDAVNGMLNKIRGTSVMGLAPFKGLWGHNPIKTPAIPRLARGGTISAGQPFVAGESGMEMFGKYNGKSTVMPLENTSFISAIERAVSRGINGGSSANSSGGVVVQIGEKTIVDILSSEMNRQTRINGKSIIRA